MPVCPEGLYEIAIKYIRNLQEKPSADHPLVKRTMRYILERYRPEIGNWGEVVEPGVNDGVHNRWVRYRGIDFTPIADENERIQQYDANEKVCFAAFVEAYPELVPADMYQDILHYPIEYILRGYDENSPEYNKRIFDEGCPYDFEYFQWFVPCLKDKGTAAKLTSILRQNPMAFMELDYTKSAHGYVHLPCDAIDSPDNIVYPVIKDLIEESLEYRMKQQSADGRSFGDDDGFRRLQVLYEAYRTLGMLVKWKRFGRME